MRFAATWFPPRAQLPLHARPVSYLSFVLSGSYVEQVGRERVECLPLSLRFHPAGEEHAHRFGESGSHCLNLELDESWAESIERLRPANGVVHVASAGRVGLRLVECCRSRELKDRAVADSIVAELLGLCEDQAGLVRASAANVCIQRAIRMIDHHLSDPLPLLVIATAAGLHPTHLARSFKKTTGMTIGDYIRRRRRECAEALLLRQAGFSIARVAAEAGFADHAHMSRTFKADLGIVPSRYRTTLLPEMRSMP